MIGVYGTIVIGKGSSKVAVGVIPNGNKTETYEVVNAEADRIITLEDGRLLHDEAVTYEN